MGQNTKWLCTISSTTEQDYQQKRQPAIHVILRKGTAAWPERHAEYWRHWPWLCWWRKPDWRSSPWQRTSAAAADWSAAPAGCRPGRTGQRTPPAAAGQRPPVASTLRLKQELSSISCVCVQPTRDIGDSPYSSFMKDRKVVLCAGLYFDIFQTGVISIRWWKWFTETGQSITVTV